MTRRTRQQRHQNHGAGTDLVRVETLVPADSRDEILKLAARLRREARKRARGEARKREPEPEQGIDVEEVIASVRALCLMSQRVRSETDR